MGYMTFEALPKSLTRKDDVGRGQIGIQHFDPGLFLELQLVKLHDHKGASSRTLEAQATPQMVKGYRPSEREEHGTATWTGSAADNGSVVLTFGAAFKEAPTVLVTAQNGDADIIVGIATPTATGVTIYWRDVDAATHTSLPISWIAKGR